ncbi:hypothetical protein LV476_02090 [Guyparkeria hydrothermalis]|uniref:hypothetical protein n=1 Tax=Guyparkeria hydrothermalis TaxID=923 RepID=UPI00202163EB|nr:hypothetical protein [Guyparkeria hydrothermalis]MCL7743742.1 hypothetical protein [Guyparkeria hydrothermalis]
MIKAKHLIAMGAGAALFATSGIASAAGMEDYKEARSAAIEAAESVESMGAGAFAMSPTGSKWKKSLMHGADKMAEKGNYEEAIAEAERIEMLQGLAKKQYESQPNPGPYKAW